MKKLSKKRHVAEFLKLQDAIAAFRNSGASPVIVGEQLLRQFRTMLSDNDLEALTDATVTTRDR
jgi:hypothetical protein